MYKYWFFTFILWALLGNITIQAQFEKDTSKAGEYFREAKALLKEIYYDSAHNYYTQAAEIYKKNKVWEKYFQSQTQALVCLNEANKLQDAENLAKRIIQESKQKLGASNLFISKALVQLARLYIATGKMKEGYEKIETALDRFIKKHPNQPLEKVDALSTKGFYYQQQLKPKQARAFYEQALNITEKHLPKKHPQWARLYNFIAITYTMEENFPKAEAYFNKAIQILEKKSRNQLYELRRVYANLGQSLMLKGDDEKLEKYNQKVLDLEQKLKVNEDDVSVLLYRNIAKELARSGNLTHAVDYLKKALTLHTGFFGEDNTLSGIIRVQLGARNRELRHFEESESNYFKAIEILEKVLGKDAFYTRLTILRLIVVQQDLKNSSNVETTLAEFDEWFKNINISDLPPSNVAYMYRN